MDDDDPRPPPAPAPKVPATAGETPGPRAVAKTEFGEPAYPAAMLPPVVGTPGPMGPSGGSTPGPPALSPTPTPPPDAPRPPEPSSPGLQPKPPSAVDTTLSDAESALLRRRARSRAVVIILLCFAVSVFATAGVLYRMGWLGPETAANTLDAQVARADEAMRHKRWDSPAGDNVRDLTDEGLARWPHDARLLDIRERAADELVKEAVGRKFEGDLPGALHLARLANQLDPTDTTAQHLVEEYQHVDKPPPPDTPKPNTNDASTSPIHSGPKPPGPGPGPTLAPTAKVSIDAAPAHPRVGQPVAFTAKVTNAAGAAPKVLEDVHFKLNGPGLTPDTRLTPIGDAPGTYRSAFTFFEAGKYELTFEARVDGVLIRTVRQVVAGDDTPGPNPPPPPSSSGKWL